jgi:hypothetical protein
MQMDQYQHFMQQHQLAEASVVVLQAQLELEEMVVAVVAEEVGQLCLLLVHHKIKTE